MRTQLARTIPVTLALLLVGLLGWPRPAGAGGGDWLDPVRDRYEPGETAVMVGYTSAQAEAGPGGVDDGPYYGHLRPHPTAAATDPADPWPSVHPTDVPLGPTTVTETGRRDQFAVRLSITFTVPAGLEPGSYEVFVCNAPCTTSLGNIVGGTLYVGVEPPEPIDRNWLIDDPAVAQLDGDDRVAGIPASRIRAGRAGTPWYDAHLTDPPPTTTSTTPTTSAPPTTSAVPGEADEAGEAEPTTVGLGDAAPWLVGVAAVAGIWWLGPRRRRRSPVVVAPAPSPPEATGAPDAPARDEALTSARS